MKCAGQKMEGASLCLWQGISVLLIPHLFSLILCSPILLLNGQWGPLSIKTAGT